MPDMLKRPDRTMRYAAATAAIAAAGLFGAEKCFQSHGPAVEQAAREPPKICDTSITSTPDAIWLRRQLAGYAIDDVRFECQTGYRGARCEDFLDAELVNIINRDGSGELYSIREKYAGGSFTISIGAPWGPRLNPGPKARCIWLVNTGGVRELGFNPALQYD